MYFLRHTLYRPRQILFHLQEVIDEWEAQSSTFRIDKTFIPGVVSRTNWTLSQYVVDSLRHTYPDLEPLLKSFGGNENIFPAKKARDHIKRFTKFKEAAEVKRHLHELIAWGFFGVGDSYPPAQGFLFSYSDPHSVNYFPQDDVLLAISPMFEEFCGTKPSLNHGIVLPRTIQ